MAQADNGEMEKNTNNSAGEGGKRICHKHELKAIQICFTCSEFLCSKCLQRSTVSGSHCNHKIGTIDEFLQIQVNQMRKSKARLNEAMKIMESRMATSDSEFENTVFAVKAQVDNTAKDLHNQVDAWHGKTTCQLDNALYCKQHNQCRKGMETTLKAMLVNLSKEPDDIDCNCTLGRCAWLAHVTKEIACILGTINPPRMKVSMKGCGAVQTPCLCIRPGDPQICGKSVDVSDICDRVMHLAEGDDEKCVPQDCDGPGSSTNYCPPKQDKKAKACCSSKACCAVKKMIYD